MSETTCSSSSQIVPTVAMKALSSNKVFHSTWMFITWKYPWKISSPMFTSKFLIVPLELNLEQSTKNLQEVSVDAGMSSLNTTPIAAATYLAPTSSSRLQLHDHLSSDMLHYANDPHVCNPRIWDEEMLANGITRARAEEEAKAVGTYLTRPQIPAREAPTINWLSGRYRGSELLKHLNCSALQMRVRQNSRKRCLKQPEKEVKEGAQVDMSPSLAYYS
ncbi:hypothetical protein DY000_02039993 [Brassica cretica]|uniref:Uncharacterized protein n=1 Tax=Brassica cretica TaxID=69181 RepID=A0ABQ7BIS9_BRACR|nr:hypothetical protein DY000_02039993 [Brassica cretica]